MSEARRTGTIWLLIVIAALLLFAGYVGAYYAMVEPAEVYEVIYAHKVPTFPAVEPKGSAGKATAWTRFFAPVHWVDRRLRRDVWASVSHW